MTTVFFIDSIWYEFPEKRFISKNKINKFSGHKKFSTYCPAIMIADLNYLKTMSGGDSKFIREMIELFREQIEEYNVVMPDLLRRKEYDGLSRSAHKAKSSVAVMGMAELADLLKDLESLAREGKEVERYEAMVSEFLQQSRMALEELDNTPI